MNVCFTGNAPTNVSAHTFDADINVGIGGDYAPCNVTVYARPGTTGWGPTLAGRPVWDAHIVRDESLCMGSATLFGVHTNGPWGPPGNPSRFGFFVMGNTNFAFVVEASTSLGNPVWTRLATNALRNFQYCTSGHAWYFGDPDWTNYPTRLYRLQWPL